MKTPENILYSDDESNEIRQAPVAEVIKQVVKQYKVKASAEKPANEIVKDILTIAFRNKGDEIELGEDMEHLQKVANHCLSIASEHRKISEAEAEKAKQAKALKAQEKDLAKEAKAAEEKQYTENFTRFEELFVKKAASMSAKVNDQVVATMKSISLPKTISLSRNGMGIVLAENASKDDLATAAAAMIAASEGNKSMDAALSFVMGDLVNAAAEKKIFRNKGDACKGIKLLIEDKLGKKYAAGSINANSLMAERVKPQDRKMGIAPSLYYLASKVVAPRLKEASDKERSEYEKKFDGERDNVISLINEGKITSVKEVTKHVEDFKASIGLVKQDPGAASKAIQKYLFRLFWATWVGENLVNDGVAKVHELKTNDTSPPREYSVGELTDIKAEALNNLQNLLVSGRFGYNVTDLIKGYSEIEDEKTKVVSKTPCLIQDPFEEPKAVEPTPEPTSPAETEEEEEEEDDEGEDAV